MSDHESWDVEGVASLSEEAVRAWVPEGVGSCLVGGAESS